MGGTIHHSGQIELMIFTPVSCKLALQPRYLRSMDVGLTALGLNGAKALLNTMPKTMNGPGVGLSWTVAKPRIVCACNWLATGSGLGQLRALTNGRYLEAKRTSRYCIDSASVRSWMQRKQPAGIVIHWAIGLFAFTLDAFIRFSERLGYNE